MRVEQYLRREFQKEQLGDEVYFPEWKCFACNDTGFIRPHQFFQGDILAELRKKNIAIACTCGHGTDKGEGVARFDEISFDACLQVHHLNRQAWVDSAKNKAAIATQTKEALSKLKMDMPYARPQQNARLSNAEIAEIEATLTPVAITVAPEPEEDLPF